MKLVLCRCVEALCVLIVIGSLISFIYQCVRLDASAALFAFAAMIPPALFAYWIIMGIERRIHPD